MSRCQARIVRSNSTLQIWWSEPGNETWSDPLKQVTVIIIYICLQYVPQKANCYHHDDTVFFYLLFVLIFILILIKHILLSVWKHHLISSIVHKTTLTANAFFRLIVYWFTFFTFILRSLSNTDPRIVHEFFLFPEYDEDHTAGVTGHRGCLILHGTWSCL